MTQWAVIVPTSSPLRIGAVGAFIEEGQISNEPPPDIRVGDGGYLSFQDNSRGSFTVEDVHDGEILLLETDTGLRWGLSPANEEEKKLAPATTQALRILRVRRSRHQQKTKEELEAIIRERTRGMEIQHLQVNSDPDIGWSVTVMASPDLVAGYQTRINEIASELRTEFDLKP